MKKLIFIPLTAVLLSGCSSLEPTIISKNHIPAYTQYVDCRGQVGCGGDGFVAVEIPDCWQVTFSDLWGGLDECVPKKAWEKTEIGERWYSTTLNEKMNS